MDFENSENFNECVRNGMCSISPRVSSFNEVILLTLRASIKYVYKLEQKGNKYLDVKLKLLKFLSNLITTTTYTDESLLNLFITLFNIYVKLKREYSAYTDNLEQNNDLISEKLNITPDTVFSEILNKGESLAKERTNNINFETKCYQELILHAVKSASRNILKLSENLTQADKNIDVALTSVILANRKSLTTIQFKNIMQRLAKTELQLWKMRNEKYLKEFGNTSKTNVDLSGCIGKAVLVSGEDLNDLLKVLENLEKSDINIYTHGNLLISHAFDKFKSFKNLRGHIYSQSENFVADYATFPGAVILTQNTNQNLEYLIRGRIFTLDDLIPKGAVKLKDYSDIIKTANEAKGIRKTENRGYITVGFDENYLNSEFNELATRVNSGEIKKIILIGMGEYKEYQAKYFEIMCKSIPNDVYIISFSYEIPVKNSISINVAGNLPIQLKVLNLLFSKIPSKNDIYSFFITKCSNSSLSGMIILKNMDINNIFLADCSPNVINPYNMKKFMQIYNIEPMQDPILDLGKAISDI